MTGVHPIRLPGGFVRDQGIDLVNKFAWMHRAVCTGPGGDRYVLSDLTYNHYRYNDLDRDRQMLAGHVLTRYDPEGAPVAQVFVEWARAQAGGTFPPVSLSVLPDGRVLFSAKDNRAWVLDAALGSAEEVTAPAAPGEPHWAYRTRLTPSGRALCLLGENVVAVSADPVGAAWPPELAAVTALRRTRDGLHTPGYCPPSGRSGEGEPRTELVEQVEAAFPGPGTPRLAWLDDVVPVGESMFVAVAGGWRKWAYKRGGDFLFMLVDADGKLLSHLDLHGYRDSAARGVRYDVVADQARRRIFHLNTFGLYVFDDTGTRRAVLSTGDKEYKPLAQFQLREFGPSGELVLVHEKQHLVLTVHVPDDLAELPAAVTDALAVFRKGRSQLKKRHAPSNWHWTTGDVPFTVL